MAKSVQIVRKSQKQNRTGKREVKRLLANRRNKAPFLSKVNSNVLGKVNGFTVTRLEPDKMKIERIFGKVAQISSTSQNLPVVQNSPIAQQPSTADKRVTFATMMAPKQDASSVTICKARTRRTHSARDSSGESSDELILEVKRRRTQESEIIEDADVRKKTSSIRQLEAFRQISTPGEGRKLKREKCASGSVSGKVNMAEDDDSPDKRTYPKTPANLDQTGMTADAACAFTDEDDDEEEEEEDEEHIVGKVTLERLFDGDGQFDGSESRQCSESEESQNDAAEDSENSSNDCSPMPESDTADRFQAMQEHRGAHGELREESLAATLAVEPVSENSQGPHANPPVAHTDVDTFENPRPSSAVGPTDTALAGKNAVDRELKVSGKDDTEFILRLGEEPEVVEEGKKSSYESNSSETLSPMHGKYFSRLTRRASLSTICDSDGVDVFKQRRSQLCLDDEEPMEVSLVQNTSRASSVQDDSSECATEVDAQGFVVAEKKAEFVEVHAQKIMDSNEIIARRSGTSSDESQIQNQEQVMTNPATPGTGSDGSEFSPKISAFTGLDGTDVNPSESGYLESSHMEGVKDLTEKNEDSSESAISRSLTPQPVIPCISSEQATPDNALQSLIREESSKPASLHKSLTPGVPLKFPQPVPPEKHLRQLVSGESSEPVIPYERSKSLILHDSSKTVVSDESSAIIIPEGSSESAASPKSPEPGVDVVVEAKDMTGESGEKEKIATTVSKDNTSLTSRYPELGRDLESTDGATRSQQISETESAGMGATPQEHSQNEEEPKHDHELELEASSTINKSNAKEITSEREKENLQGDLLDKQRTASDGINSEGSWTTETTEGLTSPGSVGNPPSLTPPTVQSPRRLENIAEVSAEKNLAEAQDIESEAESATNAQPSPEETDEQSALTKSKRVRRATRQYSPEFVSKRKTKTVTEMAVSVPSTPRSSRKAVARTPLKTVEVKTAKTPSSVTTVEPKKAQKKSASKPKTTPSTRTSTRATASTPSTRSSKTANATSVKPSEHSAVKTPQTPAAMSSSRRKSVK